MPPFCLDWLLAADPPAQGSSSPHDGRDSTANAENVVSARERSERQPVKPTS